jgi:hypothetical protein
MNHSRGPSSGDSATGQARCLPCSISSWAFWLQQFRQGRRCSNEHGQRGAPEADNHIASLPIKMIADAIKVRFYTRCQRCQVFFLSVQLGTKPLQSQLDTMKHLPNPIASTSQNLTLFNHAPALLPPDSVGDLIYAQTVNELFSFTQRGRVNPCRLRLAAAANLVEDASARSKQMRRFALTWRVSQTQ